jgi:hypothetical protein
MGELKQMNIRSGIGMVSVLLAIAVYFVTDMAAWLAVGALVLATVAAAMRQHLLALATVVLMVLKMAYIDPTLWTLVLGDQREGTRTVDALRVFLAMLMIAPLVAIGVNKVYSRMTDKLIAAVAMAMLIGFVAVMIWHVPQAPMIIVFVLAIGLGLFDFWRELRTDRDITGR